MLAGMMQHPRATSLRISSGSSFSRFATYSISSLITPCRARCICETFLFPFAPAAAASLFSIQLSRSPIEPPQKPGRKPSGSTRLQFEVELWHPDSSAATYRIQGSYSLEFELDHMLLVVDAHGVKLIQDIL